MVAWHEVPGKPTSTVPSRRERYDLWFRRQRFSSDDSESEVVVQVPHLRPYPTGRINCLGFPGTSCQATITMSLRDRKTLPDVCAFMPVKGFSDFHEHESGIQ
jgi:hypothetical protein